jgi:SPX domain protein involved in polyphosphate accumulation
MTTQTIERETLRDILREILYEDRNLLKRLVKEIIDEQKAPVVQESVVLESFDVPQSDEIRVLKNIDAIMLKHDNLLKRLAQ